MKKAYVDLFECLSETEKKQSKLRGVISAAIESKRFELGLTQKEFAEELGVSQGMISKLESTEYNITVDKLVEIFETLEIDYSISISQKNCISSTQVQFGGEKFFYNGFTSPKIKNGLSNLKIA